MNGQVRFSQQYCACDAVGLKPVKHVAHNIQTRFNRDLAAKHAQCAGLVKRRCREISVVPFAKQTRALFDQAGLLRGMFIENRFKSLHVSPGSYRFS